MRHAIVVHEEGGGERGEKHVVLVGASFCVCSSAMQCRVKGAFESPSRNVIVHGSYWQLGGKNAFASLDHTTTAFSHNVVVGHTYTFSLSLSLHDSGGLPAPGGSGVGTAIGLCDLSPLDASLQLSSPPTPLLPPYRAILSQLCFPLPPPSLLLQMADNHLGRDREERKKKKKPSTSFLKEECLGLCWKEGNSYYCFAICLHSVCACVCNLPPKNMWVESYSSLPPSSSLSLSETGSPELF